MSELDLHKIRKVLEDEREILMRTLVDQDAGEDEDQNPDEMDLADRSADQEVKVSLDHLSEDVLERIGKALGRLEAGTYGKCLGCGKEILAERLLALPYAEFCVRCQASQEERERGTLIQ